MVICRRTIVDQDSGLISLMDCIEGVNLAKSSGNISVGDLPLNLASEHSVAMQWARASTDEMTYPAKLKIIATDDTLISENEIEIDFGLNKGEALGHRSIVKMGSLAVHGDGELTYVVEVKLNDKWEEMGRQSLRIKLERSVSGAPAPGS